MGEEVDPGAEGRALCEIKRAPCEHERVLRLCLPAYRLGECRLPDPRFSADQHESAMPGEGRIEVVAQDGKFALAPDEQGRVSW
jgi:hypothetical protein